MTAADLALISALVDAGMPKNDAVAIVEEHGAAVAAVIERGLP